MSYKKNILFIGQLTDISGYGTAARSYLDSLIKLEESGKINLGVINWSFESKSQIEPEQYNKVQKYSLTKSLLPRSGQYEAKDLQELNKFTSQEYEVVFFLLNDWMAFGHTDKNYLCNKSNGVYPCVVWESDMVPQIWKDTYKTVPIKKLLCACDWNEDTFSTLGYDTEVLPYGMDFEKSYDQEYYEKLALIFKDKFVFTSVFQWGSRKGIEKLIRAFQLEFVNDPNAFLVLKTYYSKPMTGQDEVQFIKDNISKYTNSLYHYGRNIKPKCKIVVINKLLTRQELNSLYKLTDVYITTTRGEGFGLPMVESLNYQTPVIAPSIGGHLDFLDIENNFLTDCTLEPVIGYDNGLWSSYEGNWVETSISSTKEKMRACYSLPKQQLQHHGSKASEFMREYLSVDRCTGIWEKVLEV